MRDCSEGKTASMPPPPGLCVSSSAGDRVCSYMFPIAAPGGSCAGAAATRRGASNVGDCCFFRCLATAMYLEHCKFWFGEGSLSWSAFFAASVFSNSTIAVR